MVLNMRPKQAFGFFIEEMDDESVIYRLGAHKAIYLNSTAAAIWRMSDGSRTVQDLVDFLKAEYPEDAGAILGDVTEAVNLLSREGAVILSSNDQRPQASE